MDTPQEDWTQRIDALVNSLSREEILGLDRDWRLFAHEHQLPPQREGWTEWIMRGGRGSGKTRGATEFIRQEVNAGRARCIAMVARTLSDAFKTMVRGPSGILTICRADAGNIPAFNQRDKIISWPNGAQAHCYTADEPDSLRGPEFDLAWCDELPHWRHQDDTWNNLQLCLRKGEARVIVTSTPRPTPLFKRLLSMTPPDCVTRASTFDNAAHLSPAYIAKLRERFVGTRLARQELYGEVLDDNPGAIFALPVIEQNRVAEKDVPPLIEMAVGVDPSGGETENHDAIGIVVAGRDARRPAHYYIVADLTMHGTPERWGRAVIGAWRNRTDRRGRIVAEQNFGGAMVRSTIVTAGLNAGIDGVPVTLVHASQSKRVRAEPLSALAEQGRLHHVGVFAELEDEMCDWNPNDRHARSPNRLDAAVFAVTALMPADALAAPVRPFRGLGAF